MITRRLLTILLILPCSILNAQEPPLVGCQAVIKAAVADMSVSFPAPENAPASPEVKACRRAHQGLYNEIVDCIEEREENVKVRIKNIIYGFDANRDPLSTFWVHKKYLAHVATVMNSDARQALPTAQKQTLVLVYPWNNISLGTRLVRCLEKDTENDYAVMLGDYAAKTNTVIYIPRLHAMCDDEVTAHSAGARTLFVGLLNQLINRTSASSNEVVPYVWGGGSFINAHPATDFFQKDGAWERTAQGNLYTGYDCSELVFRMAQLAGISFPWKTSTMIGEQCRPLTNDDGLEEGDLIWMPGHVMIIGDMQHNEIIEARGYASGYGRVHRIKLEECFKDITSFKELLDAHYAQRQLVLMNKAGVGKNITFKLVKLF